MKKLIFLLLLSACAHEKFDPKLSDHDLRRDVEDALLLDERVVPTIPKVEVKDGIVTLTGKLNNQVALDAALETTRKTDYIKGVVNKLEVIPHGTEAEQNLKLEAEAALQKSLTPEQRQGIEVEVEGDVVILKGDVRNDYIREKAWFADANVEGVDRVQNQLKIEDEGRRQSDRALENKINTKLMWNPEIEWLDDKVSVYVKDQVAFIVGEVDSEDERQAVLRAIKKAGVTRVVDELKII